jgi:hypothetical protein
LDGGTAIVVAATLVVVVMVVGFAFFAGAVVVVVVAFALFVLRLRVGAGEATGVASFALFAFDASLGLVWFVGLVGLLRAVAGGPFACAFG